MLKRYGMYLLMTLLAAAAAVLIYDKLNPPTLPKNLIAGTGRIDGDLIALNTKYPGRLARVEAEEGKAVSRAETLAVLQSGEFRAKLRAIEAGIAAAKAELAAQKKVYEIARVSIPIEIKKAKNALAVARTGKKELDNTIATLETVVAQDRRDFNRTQTLYEKKLIGHQKVELAGLKLTDDTNKLAALRQKRRQAEGEIDIAADNVALAQSRQKKIAALQDGIAAAEKKIAALEANRDEMQLTIDQLTLVSPVDGFVVEKVAQPGEVLGAGMVVATLIDPDTLYLKIFVDTMENGRIKLGDKAEIFLDARPDRPIPAKVVRIAQQAEFTPKEVSVRSDRIQRVFAVHLKPAEPDPLLKLGLPAIGVVSVDGKGLPASLKRLPPL